MPPTPPPKRLHFIYGVHLDPKLLATHCYGAQALAVARLDDFQLDFCGYTMKWDGGEEALQPRPGAATWGVVYALDLLDGERLDQEFSVRLDGTGSYFHYPADVVDRQGQRHSVLLYMRNSFGSARPPSTEYLQRLVQGGRQMGLPEDYLATLAAHPAVPAAYPVPKGGTLRHIINLEQSDCHC